MTQRSEIVNTVASLHLELRSGHVRCALRGCAASGRDRGHRSTSRESIAFDQLHPMTIDTAAGASRANVKG